MKIKKRGSLKKHDKKNNLLKIKRLFIVAGTGLEPVTFGL